MANQEIAEIFFKIADILELQDVKWKPQAYRKAAQSISSMSEDVSGIYKEGGIKSLEDIPGVGEGLAKKIIQFIEEGRIHEYERLRKELPKGLDEIMQIQGMGPKKAKFLYKSLGIKSVDELKKAAQQHKIAKLPSFKEKSEENILKGIELLKSSKGRLLLGYALPIARGIELSLKNLNQVKQAAIAGSLRRMKETIHDIDILATASNPSIVIDHFTSMPIVSRVLAKGDTKATIITKEGIQVDLRVVDDALFGSALQYLTGSKEHSIILRRLAIKKGYKLSEYGLFRKNKVIASKTEKDIYNKLGMDCIPPELREDHGEIEAASRHKLPDLISYKDAKGDFHVHSTWSDGTSTIKEMADAAINFNYEFLAICDHSQSLKIANGLDKKRLLKQMQEIDSLNKKMDIRILKGAEIDIKSDGSLDIEPQLLKQLDLASISIHSGFKSPKEKMTSRILKAMDNRCINILCHPTGRMISQREPYAVDLDKIFDKSRERGIALEINAFPDRLDLIDTAVKEAVSRGVRLSIGTDSHAKDQLRFMELGIAVARRGWAAKNDIINTYNLNKLMKFLER